MNDPRSIATRSDDPTSCLLAWAQAQPDAPAYLAPGRAAMTFGELARRIRAARDRLGAWGIARGDVVAWVNSDRPSSAAAQAIVPTSAAIAPVSRSIPAEAFADLLERLRPKAVALPAGTSRALADIARALDVARIAVHSDPSGPAGSFDLELVHPGASLDRPARVSPGVACICGTSGSTGKPRLVPHGHRQWMAMIRAIGERLAIGPGDISGHAVPLHLANGIRAAHAWSLLNGGAVAILPEADPQALLDAIDRGEVTYFSASFAIQRELLARLGTRGARSPGRLRFVRVASGRLEPEEMERLEEAFGVPVVTGLASSEAGFVAHQGLPPEPRRRGSVGVPLDNTIRIGDEQGNALPSGEIGEILVRGPQVFDGYLDDPAANDAAFVGGWFRLGDLGRVDEHGELCVVGRLKEIINRGGEKISPATIDPVMRAVPGVIDAAAFGVPHPRLGEEVVAAVVRSGEHLCSAEEVIAAVRAKLGARLAPRRVWFVDALPRNDAGKLQRMVLTQRFAARESADRQTADDVAGTCSALELALAELWKSALGAERLSPVETFLAQGGDDDSAAQLVGLVRSAFGVEIGAEALHGEAATLRSMAGVIEAMRERPL